MFKRIVLLFTALLFILPLSFAGVNQISSIPDPLQLAVYNQGDGENISLDTWFSGYDSLNLSIDGGTLSVGDEFGVSNVFGTYVNLYHNSTSSEIVLEAIDSYDGEVTFTAINSSDNSKISVNTTLQNIYTPYVLNNISDVEFSFGGGEIVQLQDKIIDANRYSLTFYEPQINDNVTITANYSNSDNVIYEGSFKVNLRHISSPSKMEALFQDMGNEYNDTITVTGHNEVGTAQTNFTLTINAVQPNIISAISDKDITYNEMFNISMNNHFEFYEKINVSYFDTELASNVELSADINGFTDGFSGTFNADLDPEIENDNIYLFIDSNEINYNDTITVEAINSEGVVTDTFNLQISEFDNPPTQIASFSDILMEHNDQISLDLNNYFNDYNTIELNYNDAEAGTSVFLSSSIGGNIDSFSGTFDSELNPQSDRILLNIDALTTNYNDTLTITALNSEGSVQDSLLLTIEEPDPPTQIANFGDVVMNYNETVSYSLDNYFTDYEEIEISYNDPQTQQTVVLSGQLGSGVTITDYNGTFYTNMASFSSNIQYYIDSKFNDYNDTITLTASNSGGSITDNYLLTIESQAYDVIKLADIPNLHFGITQGYELTMNDFFQNYSGVRVEYYDPINNESVNLERNFSQSNTSYNGYLHTELRTNSSDIILEFTGVEAPYNQSVNVTAFNQYNENTTSFYVSTQEDIISPLNKIKEIPDPHIVPTNYSENMTTYWGGFDSFEIEIDNSTIQIGDKFGVSNVIGLYLDLYYNSGELEIKYKEEFEGVVTYRAIDSLNNVSDEQTFYLKIDEQAQTPNGNGQTDMPGFIPDVPDNHKPYYALAIMIFVTALIGMNANRENFLGVFVLGAIVVIGLFLLFTAIGWIPAWILFTLLIIIALIFAGKLVF